MCMYINICIILCTHTFPSDNLLQVVINIITGSRKKIRYLWLPKEQYSGFWNSLWIGTQWSWVDLWLLTIILTSSSIWSFLIPSFTKFPSVLVFKEINLKFLARWRCEAGRRREGLIGELAFSVNYGMVGICKILPTNSLLEPHNSSVKCYYYLPFTWGKWSLERLNNLPKITWGVTELWLESKRSDFAVNLLVCRNLLNTGRRELPKNSILHIKRDRTRYFSNQFSFMWKYFIKELLLNFIKYSAVT